MFASRVFRHSFIFINKKHVKSPKEIEGKRIGVPVYTMTAAIFIRGLLSDEHGIDFSNCEWVEGDINSARPHGNPTILPTAKKLSISANKSGKSLSKMLEDGELSRHHRHRRAGGVSAAIPISCASIRTIARPRWNTTSAPRSSRSCTPW